MLAEPDSGQIPATINDIGAALVVPRACSRSERTDNVFTRVKDMSSVMSSYGRLPVSMQRGEGLWLWDVDGNKYLDAHGGIAVCAPVSYTHLTLPTICSV